MLTREAVRSGRRANFFITENRFIDHYAAKVGGSGVAVYSILQRCANSETRETWISAGKMAEVLDIDKSTVYRKLRELEDLRLIKTLRTREKTIYIVLEVPPPRPEAGPAPLFDRVEPNTRGKEPSWPPVAEARTNGADANDSYDRDSTVAPPQVEFAPVQSVLSHMQNSSRTWEKRNKEEQDLLNKTQEQDIFNKNCKQANEETRETAKRIVNILGLPDASLHAAIAAVETKSRQTKLSPDGIVQDIVTAANHAERRGVESRDFLEDFLAHTLAEEILKSLGLPLTASMIGIVTAAVKAEATYAHGLPTCDAAALITSAALEDANRGVPIDRFYFENVKWRSNARANKAEQRKLGNLEVHARVRQRLRERFGPSQLD